MPYITREDGEHFVIPSYRDVLTARNKTQLKKDILLLSQSYGEYITLQRKSTLQYEVAFSPDTGYLLGESIWHYFKRPLDMIYCEAIPNTTEAILVIVKSGSVYLDGSFPLDSIPEELIIFLTQQNNFEIYIYGDVPISQTPTDGKFSFEESSVKSFTVLDKPIFPIVPLLKIYQLQLVDTVLRAHGIGVFPARQILTAIAAIGVLWFLYSYFTKEKAPEPVRVSEFNPYQEFNTTLASSSPDQLMKMIVQDLYTLFTMPGWVAERVHYENKMLTADVKSLGGKIEELSNWAQANGAVMQLTAQGISIQMTVDAPARPLPSNIYSLKQVVATFSDNLSTIYPGNRMSIKDIVNKGSFLDMTFTINIDNVPPLVLSLIGEKLKDLPFVLQKIDVTLTNGYLSGSITIEALGSQL